MKAKQNIRDNMQENRSIILITESLTLIKSRSTTTTSRCYMICSNNTIFIINNEIGFYMS